MSTDSSPAPTSRPAPATGTAADPAPGTSAQESHPARPAGPPPSRLRNLLVVVAGMVALPWFVWGSAIAQAHGLLPWRVPQGLALWVLAPSVAVVALVVGGRAGLRDLGRETHDRDAIAAICSLLVP